jgi:SpoIID/LytB domain protein
VNAAGELSVGLMERRDAVEVELQGSFVDAQGRSFAPGIHRFHSEIELYPADKAACAFALNDVTIGIGFHWERNERQVFRGALRILKRDGFTVINDVPLEEYVASVISSEMSAGCPIELLKAHAVISRSWLCCPQTGAAGNVSRREGAQGDEIVRWYGREAHRDFDVCADDHCQRYQGITKAYAPAVAAAVQATSGEMLVFEDEICDARFSKCCGGITEEYRSAWEDRDVPYLVSRYDGEGDLVYCDTQDRELLSQILPGFDLETRDFYRWTVRYTPDEIRDLLRARLNEDVGRIVALEPLSRGPGGRIIRLRIVGDAKTLIVGKELEIRRALSTSHLYSSAFEVERAAADFILKGTGWGHGVGLCQIGAAVMASRGWPYHRILSHYYAAASLKRPISRSQR